MWKIVATPQWKTWLDSLSEKDRLKVRLSVDDLEREGPALTRPRADTIHGSKLKNLRELRTQSGGRPLRTFYAFDPKRQAILLVGGDKTGDKRFYERMIPIAEALFAKHLDSLRHGDLP